MLPTEKLQPAKLRLDFATAIALLRRMIDAADLIERLLTSAAMIMEDSVDIALVKYETGLAERLATTLVAGQDIAALTKAAEIIARRWA